MNDLNKLLEKSISASLIGCIISNKRNKLGGTDKIKIRQVILKNRHMFQITEYAGNKVYHKNEEAGYVKDYIKSKLLTEFKQCEIKCDSHTATVLVSSGGKFTVKEKAAKFSMDKSSLEHNRKKEYLLPEGTPVPFLIELGVMTQDGKIVRQRYDKFRQINRFLEFIQDILPALDKDREINILDFGCGKSYLTFAMYHYLREIMGYNIRITGLDLKSDVINECSRLAEKFGYNNLKFICGDVAEYGADEKVDMMVTLHACDTATDYALARAVQWGADVILSVPCCQHELNKTIKNDILAPVFSYGIIKERTAALMTDGLRGCMLDISGYDTQLLEFIDMEHTPKNILIRAVRRKNGGKPSYTIDNCLDIMSVFNVKPSLYRLLFEEGSATGKETD